MNALFFAVCGLSVVFFAVFLVECSRPHRRSTKSVVVRKSNAAEVVDLGMGRRFFVHLEQQMAEFLSHHGRTAAVLLVALLAMPLSLRAQGTQPTTQEANARNADSALVGSPPGPQQNPQTDTASTQSSSTSSNAPKAAAANDPAASTDAAVTSGSALQGNFFQRFGQAYLQ